MQQHYTFHIELQNLNKKILHLSAMAEDRLAKAVEAINTEDETLIQSIILSDYEIDEMEIEIEEDCLKILALHQPVASDLRFIISVIKINNEIERIADMAVSIAMRVQTISKEGTPVIKDGFDFSLMSEKAIKMLRTSLDALVQRDAAMARSVFHLDDEVDELRNQAYTKVKELLKLYPTHPGCLINSYLIARHLERIGDRATNIAEEVIYLVEGSIVRSS